MNSIRNKARLAIAGLLYFTATVAISEEITIRWMGSISNTNIQYEGQFTFEVDDPEAVTIVDLLDFPTNTDVVVSDDINSETWNYTVPAPPNDHLLFRYCPGGENQCGIPAPGSFVAATLPSWTGTFFQTECNNSTPSPCSLGRVELRGEDSPVGLTYADIGIYQTNFSFEIIPNPVETPQCELEMSQATYVDGETVTAQVFRFSNTTDSAVATEIKIWLGVPGLAPLSVVNIGADGSFLLPAGTDLNLGPLPLLPVTPGLPRGDYEFSCRMLDPVTGALLFEDINTFEVDSLAPLTSIEVTPMNPTVSAGSNLQFSATGHYADGSSRDITADVEWSSSFIDEITIDNSPGNEGLATITTVASAAITAHDIASGIVGGTTIVDETGYYLDLTNVSLNGAGTSAIVAANGPVNVNLDFTIWSRIGCPACIDWIALGIEDDGQDAHGVGIPGTAPGVSGSAGFSLTAPAAPGSYKVFGFLAPDFTAPEALIRYEANYPDNGLIHIGTITVQ